MIEFTDAGGDTARTYVGQCSGNYIVECVSEGEFLPVALLPSMARALAADMIAWADSVEAQTAPVSPIPYETARERLDSEVEKHSITERGTK